jgi:hypothetical protein
MINILLIIMGVSSSATIVVPFAGQVKMILGTRFIGQNDSGPEANQNLRPMHIGNPKSDRD